MGAVHVEADTTASVPLHIVLVEDDQAHVALIQRAFASQSRQVQVTVVGDLRAAHAYLATARPDLVIVDWRLPDGSGLDLLAPTADTAAYPVVVMTSHGNEQVAVDAMRAGAVDYVVKSATTLADMPHIAARALRAWAHIVERRQTEAALRQSEERYRDLFENANDILYTHDLAGNFTSINRAAERITGYSRQEALRLNLADVVAPEHLELVRQMTASKLAGLPVTTYELDMLTKSGRRVTLEVSTRLIIHRNTPIGVQSIGRDITERNRFTAQLRQAQKMEAVGTLAGGIAHDFNNILAAILGYTDLALYDVPQSNRAWHNLQEVLTAGNRAKELVRQILAFSRQIDQERKPLQLHFVIKEALILLRASLPSTIALQLHLDEAAGTVLADAIQMHQVLLNLCTNAAHAMRNSGGVLEIRLDAVQIEAPLVTLLPKLQMGPYVRLTVRDTGHGIAPNIQERILDPFFTTKAPGEGTGMGLAIVHGIVTSHGGIINVESTVGQGTTCEVYLPRIADRPSDAALADAPPPTGTGCILFVDDEEPLARLGQEILRHLGYEVVIRTSGVEALEAFRSVPQRFDLVITDQTMPRMTGETLAHELRGIRPDIPIILCTGFSYLMSAEKAHTLGIDAFCMKPLTTQDLAQVVQQVLARRRASSSSNSMTASLEAPTE